MFIFAAAAWAGILVPVQGVLLDGGGAPMHGTADLTFSLYDAASGGNLRFDEVLAVDLVDGRFSAVLGSSEVLTDAVFKSDRDLWLSVAVGAQSPSDRVAIGTTPYASRAAWADGAALADLATNATNAQSAVNATTAENATSLGGQPASAYLRRTETIPWTSLDLDQGTPAGWGLRAISDTLSVSTTDLDARYVANGGAFRALTQASEPFACNQAGLAGSMYYDSALLKLRFCNGSRWVAVDDTTSGATLVDVSGSTALTASGSSFSGWTASGGLLNLSVAALEDLIVTTGQSVTLAAGTHTYRDVVIQSGATLTVAAWDGTTGGKIELVVGGTFEVQAGGTVNLRGKGSRGGTALSARSSHGMSGESLAGLGVRTPCTRNAGGGGGGQTDVGNYGQAGAGGGYGTAGTDGITRYTGCNSQGGAVYGDDDITVLYLGAGGGSAGTDGDKSGWGGDGGRGGGSIRIDANRAIISGTIDARGDNGGDFRVESDNGGGGGGAGGAVRIWADTLTVASTGVIHATGGAGGTHSNANPGGVGGHGRIYLGGRLLTMSGTLNGTARKQVSGIAPPTLPAVEGTYLSAPIENTGGAAPSRLDVFMNRPVRSSLVVSVCGATTSSGTNDPACWRGVANSGAVPSLPAYAWLRVRVQVVGLDDSGVTAEPFQLSGFRFTR
jgi:hypothetical protein